MGLTPQQAFHKARPGSHVIGWKLDRAQRDGLLARFAPRYPNVVADHVTLKFGVQRHSAPPGAVIARIVGRADDGIGVEAMIVEIDGSTHRPDGGTYHITWSLAEGRKAKESNEVIRDRGWTRWGEAVSIQLDAVR